MTTPLAFGWRTNEYRHSSGLDFLGLAMPIERILDFWTPGVTNATQRARYFSIVPWIQWRYANLGGAGSPSDQRIFIRAHETFLAYVNVAYEQQLSSTIPGVVRRRWSARQWRKSNSDLLIRGQQVAKTPSTLDAALYGPAFSRLRLLGKRGHFITCLPAGQKLAEVFDETVQDLPGYRKLLTDSTVTRATVLAWSAAANLEAVSPKEKRLLRALFFAQAPFKATHAHNRVRSLLLMLWLASHSHSAFIDWDIEVAVGAGKDLTGKPLAVPGPLEMTARHWRITAILKLLRHATESGFKALHLLVQVSGVRYPSIQAAVSELLAQYSAQRGNAKFNDLVVKHRRASAVPTWAPEETTPGAVLGAALDLVAWCFARLETDDGQELLNERIATLGDRLGSDLVTYHEYLHLKRFDSVRDVAHWLLIDRGIARHNRVAAGKLWEHDTYRLVEDESGVIAIGKCPLPNITVRVGAMLSLLRDLGILKLRDGKYTATDQCKGFMDEQLARDW